eukprot:1178878-Prorocentrum_minimum.AAC.5
MRIWLTVSFQTVGGHKQRRQNQQPEKGKHLLSRVHSPSNSTSSETSCLHPTEPAQRTNCQGLISHGS